MKVGRRKTPESNIQGSICLAPWMPTKKLAEHSRLFIVGIRRVTQVQLLNKHMINSSRVSLLNGVVAVAVAVSKS
ncbi:hypothetical protein OIU85_010764 [Salix viminalis]|uniref:Uncharacterized protein n=1 Tax=Salix viminalis TaxID=40686 RepID=A0A9Q0NRB3_SALVM|nr:hypothetical protein OIU85_010764 [Salix viminalis]